MKQIATQQSSGQLASQVCSCHDTRMHCVRVVCFVKTLGLSQLRLLVVWCFACHALHRYNSKSEVCQTTGACSTPVGLEYAVCKPCMCLVRTSTGLALSL